MKTFNYQIDINAPKSKVWDVMLGDQTYREWSSAFMPGSYYEGGWNKGDEIRFLAPDDGKLSGMSSKIVENKPYEFVSIEHLGEVVDSKDDFTSDNAKMWAGAHENYYFSEENGVTTVKVEIEDKGMSEEMAKMFDDMWQEALVKLKEVAER